MQNNALSRLETMILSWDGPYSVQEVKNLDKANKVNSHGLYLVVGTRKRRQLKSLDYCGITTREFGTRIKEHEDSGRFREFKGEVEIWLGNLDHPKRHTKFHLTRAEKMLIVGWKVKSNIRGKLSLPAPTCLVMRWYFPDARARKRHPDFVRDLPDVLWFEDELWWKANLRLIEQR